MPISYDNPPLIELIVELRWGTPAFLLPSAVAGTDAGAAITPQIAEHLFMHFGAVASGESYGRFERVIPPGFPLAPFQVAYRYRPTDSENNATLYQMGNGVFSVNALPPYKNWDQFKPVIQRGVQMRNEAFKRMGIEPPPFSSGIVRYIDAFQGPLLGNYSTRAFLTDVLGFKLTMPPILEEVCTERQQIIPQLQLTLPVAPGQLQIALSEGQLNNQRAVVVDTSVTMNRQLSTDPSSTVIELTEARNVIHEIFMQIAKPLHDHMNPIEVTK